MLFSENSLILCKYQIHFFQLINNNLQTIRILPPVMEGVQINKDILQTIFLHQHKITKEVVDEIILWNQQLQPSLNMTKSIIAAFLVPHDNNNEKQQSLQKQQNVSEYQLLKQSVKDIPKLLLTLQQYKCPKNFIRAFLGVIKKYLPEIKDKIDFKHIINNWRKISPELLQFYCDAFGIQIQKYTQNPLKQGSILINHQEFDQYILQLIKQKQYNHCINLIKMSHCQKQHINALLTKMTNNKEASKAADYIKTLKLNPNDYPALGQRLYKNTARHFLTKNGWQYAEEIFQDHPQALACVIEDLIFKKRFKEVLSIWSRHPIWEHIIKEQSKIYLQPYRNLQKINQVQIKQNFLFKDKFGPSNSQKYLTLQQFGIKENDVIWVDQTSKDLQNIMKQITVSPIIGIDTQSIVGQTKFTKGDAEYQEAALIQIATKDKVFILDGFFAKNQIIKNALISYIKNDGIIIGHTLDNDMQCLLKSLGCSDQQIKTIKINNLVDIWKLFKALYPQKKYSSLAFISQTILGKQICKDQTLTNWKRRPLRRNQLHYAALDALVVVKIYEKLVEQNGEQMIQYYCNIDLNQL